MIDTDTAYERPTGKNIKLRLRELVMASKPGDVLVLHFSGHGTQVPAEAGTEKDGKDEVGGFFFSFVFIFSLLFLLLFLFLFLFLFVSLFLCLCVVLCSYQN